MTPTIGQLIDRVLGGQSTLAVLGEGVEDEWQYVQDLVAVWRSRLMETGAARGAEAASEAQTRAIDRLLDEIGRIEDPHRAIDWLSTLPQAILLALAEPLA